MNRYTGECLCGTCCYVIIGPKPSAMYLCHCSRCRKETGTMHGANVFWSNAQLHWEKGEDNLGYFELKGTRKKRSFCKTCGSPLPQQNSIGDVMLPAGSLDNDISLEPTAHIFYASRASWEEKTVGLTRFNESPIKE